MARTKQTARRGRPFNPAGQGRTPVANAQSSRIDATPSQWDSLGDYDEPPPPYRGSSAHDSYYGDNSYDNNSHSWDDQPLPPLGLLNGRYEVRCAGPADLMANGAKDSGIIFTLDGNALWGSFELGDVSGILRLDERPWQSSDEPLYFEWRGSSGRTPGCDSRAACLPNTTEA